MIYIWPDASHYVYEICVKCFLIYPSQYMRGLSPEKVSVVVWLWMSRPGFTLIADKKGLEVKRIYKLQNLMKLMGMQVLFTTPCHQSCRWSAGRRTIDVEVPDLLVSNTFNTLDKWSFICITAAIVPNIFVQVADLLARCG